MAVMNQTAAIIKITRNSVYGYWPSENWNNARRDREDYHTETKIYTFLFCLYKCRQILRKFGHICFLQISLQSVVVWCHKYTCVTKSFTFLYSKLSINNDLNPSLKRGSKVAPMVVENITRERLRFYTE